MFLNALVHLRAAQLRRILDAVMPCAGTDGGPLGAIKLEIRDGALFAAATDRYCLAAARCEIKPSAVKVGDGDVLLSVGYAAELRRMLDGHTGVVDLGLDAGRVTLDTCDGRTAGWLGMRSDLEYPDWRRLLHAALIKDPDELGDEFGLNPKFLARFDAAEPAGFGEEPLMFRWSGSAGSNSPLTLVTRGDWFIAAIMPVRMTGQASDVTAGWSSWTRWTAEAVTAS